MTPVNAALAKKEFAKAQTAYDALAKHSEDHKALQTQITDGLGIQNSLKKDVQELDEKGHFAKLEEKLKQIKSYPELTAFYAEKDKKVNAFKAAMANEVKNLETSIAQKLWSKADGTLKQIGKNPDIIGRTLVRSVSDQAVLVSANLKQQQTIAAELKTLAGEKHLALLKPALAKANDFPELADRVSAYAEQVQAKEAQVQTDLKKSKVAIAAQQWSVADAALQNIETDAKVVGETALKERQSLAQQIEQGAAAQMQVSKELNTLRDAGQFVLLEKALEKAAPFPDLTKTVADYKKQIAADADAKNKAYESALKEIEADQFLEAQASLDKIGEDSQKTNNVLIEKAKKARAQLKEKATTYFTLSVEKAVAGVQAQTKEGLQQSSKALRDAAPAAKVAGLEDQLKSVTLQLVKIIEKRSE